MSSINHRPTFHYSQPEEYRFSHDSVFLAQTVFDRIKDQLRSEDRILDLCTGCGIVGLDFLYHCRAELGFLPRECDFLEIQNEYEEHFKKNIKIFADDNVRLRFVLHNYSALLAEPENQYDYILCNPPYFHLGQGTLSPSDFKNRCRFFLDSDFPTLIKAIRHVLKPMGEAYVLVRDPDVTAALEVIGDVRGTPLVRVRKSAITTSRREDEEH